MVESGYGVNGYASNGSPVYYGGSLCDGYVYGVGECNDAPSVGGTITNIQELSGNIELTSNVIIQSGAGIVISCDANIKANGNVIIIQDGGYLNTRGKRLPEGSAIGSVLIIT